MFDELKSWFQQLVADKQTESGEVDFVLQQAKFLLTQAALLEAPPIVDNDKYSLGSGVERLRGCSTPLGYMNPITFNRIVGQYAEDHDVFYTIYGSPKTRWILTTLLPEGTLILGPNLMPGLQALMKSRIEKEDQELRAANQDWHRTTVNEGANRA